MSDYPAEDPNAQERAALAYHLLIQEPMTTRLLRERLVLSYQGARALLQKLSTAVPLVFSEVDQRRRTVDNPGQAEANETYEKT